MCHKFSEEDLDKKIKPFTYISRSNMSQHKLYSKNGVSESAISVDCHSDFHVAT